MARQLPISVAQLVRTGVVICAHYHLDRNAMHVGEVSFATLQVEWSHARQRTLCQQYPTDEDTISQMLMVTRLERRLEARVVDVARRHPSRRVGRERARASYSEEYRTAKRHVV